MSTPRTKPDRTVIGLFVLVGVACLIVLAVAAWFFVRNNEGNQLCADHGWSRADTRGAVLCVDDEGIVHRP
ncbi:hypothetical protein [Curtobacterium poinsettiae]|uniref:hypothetical protein n=1 Tax=Curtobacterium poinsettiae TaxID=159612 RepID=UPI00217E17A8|nr:hypothetical protein [Curtobacterium flaccumfaciens]MCS6578243.1 hypothetical protein [Curtobacterium flaccumfaciens]